MDNQVVTNTAQAYPVYGWVDLAWDSTLMPLSVSRSGSGRVKGPGIDCGSTCSTLVGKGKNVTLTAEAEPGWVFSGWSADCAGISSCSVTLDKPQSVTAFFTQVNPTSAQHVLSVRLTEATEPGCQGYSTGVATTTPSGLVCNLAGNAPIQCSANFDGISVKLTAAAGEATNFVGFSGDCNGTSCDITMNEDRHVTAIFCSLIR